MATTQLNMKFQDSFLEKVKGYAQEHGYMSIQELVREAVRDKINEKYEVRDEYIDFLHTHKQANTFSSAKESKAFMNKMRKKAELE
ncbi:MAG: ribbon-helix-helix domain-containing protein [Candidatus Woesearchaeota archaeon]